MEIAVFFLFFFTSSLFVIFHQKRRRKICVVRGYKERIEKLEKRLEQMEGDAQLATQNQLRFLKHGYKEYLCENKDLH